MRGRARRRRREESRERLVFGGRQIDIVRACDPAPWCARRAGVLTSSTLRVLVGRIFVDRSSCVPSPQELKMYLVPGSKLWRPRLRRSATVVTTLPVSAFSTDIICFAAGEDAPRLGVHGHAGRAFAGRQRPGMFDRQRLRIDLHHLALVFHIDEHVPASVGCANSGLPSSAIVPATLPVFGVDRGGVPNCAR